MAFALEAFEEAGLDEGFVRWLVEEKSVDFHQHYTKLWEYYSNRFIESAAGSGGSYSGRWYEQGQEYGLPARITGMVQSGAGGVFGGRQAGGSQRKEVVIENDIGWRVNAGVDFLFGRGVSFISRSPDNQKRTKIEKLLKGVFAASGGTCFFQDMAVLGSVYGFVDCFVRPGGQLLERFVGGGGPIGEDELCQVGDWVGLELIEAPRALPVLDEGDYRQIKCYIQHYWQLKNEIEQRNSFLSAIVDSRGRSNKRRRVAVTEIISDRWWQVYENGELLDQMEVAWGFLPVVHIQNIAQPGCYEGLSDVEPLIPLQDELNTRLSDRAARITLQSFKMYLGKGIEGFQERPICPGQMWHTDNMEASIEEFGGEGATPSEDLHIAEIREALDKASGVSPVVAGVLKNRLGNLTSRVALELTLMGMLSKTERKRFTYGAGIKRICRMVLGMFDMAGVLSTDESEREVEVVFASALPENTTEKLNQAKLKRELGVPEDQVLKELGYEKQV